MCKNKAPIFILLFFLLTTARKLPFLHPPALSSFSKPLMAGLQRSTETFRRSGSSGLVWEDRFLEDEMDASKPNEAQPGSSELRQSQTAGEIAVMKRNTSTGSRAYRTGCKVSPALDPPSPKLSACGFCGVFSKSGSIQKSKARRR